MGLDAHEAPISLRQTVDTGMRPATPSLSPKLLRSGWPGLTKNGAGR